MSYQYWFFDLDGTLTDSAPGITHSVQYALRKLGITPPPERELTVFVGPPLTQSFQKYFGLSEEESLVAISYYREYYRAGGMLECALYDGVSDMLKELSRNGKTCVLATCKPHEFASAIIRHFALDRYFAFVSGPEMDGTRGEKDEVIAHAIEKLSLQNKRDRILMIGDRGSDIKGAARHGIDGLGALWGFGAEDELRLAGAKYLCASPLECLPVLLS